MSNGYEVVHTESGFTAKVIVTADKTTLVKKNYDTKLESATHGTVIHEIKVTAKTKAALVKKVNHAMAILEEEG